MKMVCAWLRTKLKETKSAMLLSSTYIENFVTTDECKKLLMILDYIIKEKVASIGLTKM